MYASVWNWQGLTHLVESAAVHGLLPLLLLLEEDGGSLSLLPWSGNNDDGTND